MQTYDQTFHLGWGIGTYDSDSDDKMEHQLMPNSDSDNKIRFRLKTISIKIGIQLKLVNY